MQMGKVEKNFIMADQRTRKYTTLRKASVSSGINTMKMSSNHDMHETECMVTEDTLLQIQGGVGNIKVNSKIHKSLPLSNIFMQPQTSNDLQYINLVDSDDT